VIIPCREQRAFSYDDPKKLVVIAPHPDDETLGCGGTIARFAASGTEVSVLVVAGHLPPLYDEAAFETTHRERWRRSDHGRGGSRRSCEFGNHGPRCAGGRLNARSTGFIREIGPDMVLLPFPDRHIDHRVIFDACIVACRPVHAALRGGFGLRTLSESTGMFPGIEPVFAPEFFVETTDYMAKEKCGAGVLRVAINHAPSRSVKPAPAGKFRGSQNGCGYAEAFKVVRIVV